MLEWSWPWSFVLLPIPLLMYLVPPKLQEVGAALPLPTANLLTDSVAEQSASKWPQMMLWVIWILLVCSLARPQWVGEPITIPQEGRDIMLAVDLSESMLEQDMVLNRQRVDRLTAVKSVVGDFIGKRSGDRLGLILFADTAYLQAPMTYDQQTVKTLLDESVIGLVGRKTAIGDAVALAAKRMKSEEVKEKVLILLTDGENTSGNLAPLKALQLAKAEGMTIYTIGVGQDRRGFGGLLYGRSSIDKTMLKKLAEETGGQFFHAGSTKFLQEIYNHINKIEPVADESFTLRPTTDLFYRPLAVALLFSACCGLFSLMRSR
ncbi:vWA domain-containing protein [Algicola sagamiensis]|uniref:vWA domain-containing protein n=1 Tax=Algicola sagamiensis TaxID=163869 RepID=UPI00036E2150|nr:VWA domain-containing protein [Algicola sagamiensis]